MNKNKTETNPRGMLLRDANFRWLMSGSIISMVGDQFTMIALPWLVLTMTGDTLALGGVLAVMSVPRALLLLVGGALVDRHSPKQVLMLTKHVSTALLGLLAALVLTDHLALWMVYAIALTMGIATAFSLPAATSMIPQVVAREQLSAANGMMMGMRQLSMFAGPLLAGGLIALFGDAASGAVRDAQGLGLAFLFDAASFALSAWTLAQVKLRAQPATLQASRVPVLQAVAEGLRYCWNDRSLRVCFSYWAAVAFFVQGPVQVAMPVLADQVGHGAGAFGLLVGVHGAGTLLGIAVSGARPNLRIRNLGLTMLALDAAVGVLFMPLGAIGSLWQGMLLLLAIGVLSGFLQVTVYSWLQRHVAPAMLGRSMGLFMFNFMGIAPIAAALAGWLMRGIGVAQLFAGCGALLIVIVGLAYLLSDMKALADPKTA